MYTKEQKDELAMNYAALILHDAKLGITAENLNALAKAAGVEVEAYWPTVYARYFQKNGVSDLLKNIGGPAAPAAAAAAPAAAAAAAPAKKEEKKKESESEEGMGMDLFG